MPCEAASKRGTLHCTSKPRQVATVLAFALSSTLGALMSPAVAQDTTLIVHPRVFYYEGIQNTGKKNEAWTFGGWIGYRSAR